MKQRKETLINRDELPEAYQFQASITQHPIIRDEQGIIRYQLNPLIDYLQERVSLNDMWTLYLRGAWSPQVFMQFYRDMGYSLAGFEEVWGEELDKVVALLKTLQEAGLVSLTQVREVTSYQIDIKDEIDKSFIDELFR